MENTRSLVISLIKEDLRCNKLVLGLSSLGFDTGKYHTELSTIVFSLMELDHNNDQLLTVYFDCVDKGYGDRRCGRCKTDANNGREDL